MDIDDVPCWHGMTSRNVHEANHSINRLQHSVNKSCSSQHKMAGPLAVNWLDGCWLGFNTRTGEYIVSNNAAVVSCRSIRRRNKEERWNRDVQLGILGNPWSLQEGRVEVDPNPAAPIRYIPMVNPQVEAGPTVTKTRNEENGRRIFCTKKMVSEFGATLGCKGCLVIGQPHTEECRARITACVENDPAQAKRLEDNLTRRTEFANPEPEVLVPSEGRTDATKRARQDEIGPPQESANTRGASSSSAGADVEMRLISAGKRPLEPGGDDMVCGLDVCDGLNEYSSDAHVNDCEGDYADEVTGVTLLRDDVAKARAEEMAWCEKFKACERVTDETCVSRTGRKPISCQWRDINKGDSERVEVRSPMVAREIKQKETDSYFAEWANRR